MSVEARPWTEAPARLAPGAVVAERFRLVRELGRGGVGTVWLAHHLTLEIPCALKFFSGSGADPEIVQRFELEAKSMARLRHPHVVQTLDHGVWEGCPFIAMEYLDGESLGERLARVRRLPARDVASLFGQLSRAVDKAHELGIVHRDIKPTNLFLVPDGDRFIAKILDFGIAKTSLFEVAPGPITREDKIVGTPAYMSPEQVEATNPIDARSDLWALGVVAYECVVGASPFEGKTVGDVFGRILFKPLPVPSAVAPGVPRAFDAFWARASCRDPNGRFQTARALADALMAALEGFDVSAAPPAEAPRKTSRALLFVLGAVPAVLIGASVLLVRAIVVGGAHATPAASASAIAPAALAPAAAPSATASANASAEASPPPAADSAEPAPAPAAESAAPLAPTAAPAEAAATAHGKRPRASKRGQPDWGF